jgi:hypothetical protein
MGGFVRSFLKPKKQKPVAQDLQKAAVKEAPAGPTISELEQDETDRLLKIKRKGRRVTKLTKDEGDPTLSKKILLG